MSEETLKKYVGRYELAPNFNIEITRNAPQLYRQATSQDRLELFTQSDTQIILTVVVARITFQVEEVSVKCQPFLQAGQKVLGQMGE